MADRLGVGLVPIRKKGKLPYQTYEQSYDLEYGSATLTIHRDAFKKGDRVVLVDDLLATGGTAAASAKLIEQAGGQVVAIDFLVELAFLKGRQKLGGLRRSSPPSCSEPGRCGTELVRTSARSRPTAWRRCARCRRCR